MSHGAEISPKERHMYIGLGQRLVNLRFQTPQEWDKSFQALTGFGKGSTHETYPRRLQPSGEIYSNVGKYLSAYNEKEALAIRVEQLVEAKVFPGIDSQAAGLARVMVAGFVYVDLVGKFKEGFTEENTVDFDVLTNSLGEDIQRIIEGKARNGFTEEDVVINHIIHNGFSAQPVEKLHLIRNTANLVRRVVWGLVEGNKTEDSSGPVEVVQNERVPRDYPKRYHGRRPSETSDQLPGLYLGNPTNDPLFQRPTQVSKKGVQE